MKKLILLIVVILFVMSSIAVSQKRLDYNGYIRSAKIYLGLTPKDFKMAAKRCEEAIHYYPDRPPLEAHYILGTIYAEKNLVDSMMNHFNYILTLCDTTTEKKVKKTCEDDKYAEQIEKILFSTWINTYNDGVKVLQDAREEEQECQEYEDAMAQMECMEESMESFEDALEYFQDATKILPDSANGWVNLGLTYLRLDDTAKAMESYIKALEYNDTDLGLLTNLSTIHFNRGNFDSASIYFNKILEQELEPSSRADMLYNLAICKHNTGDIDSAIEVLNEVIEITPESPDVLYNRGAFKIRKTADIGRVANDFRDSIADGKKQYQSQVDSLNEVMGDIYHSAAEDFKKVTEISPEYRDAWEWLGNCYFYVEEWEKSAESFEELVNLDPDYEDAWCQLAIIYTRLNQPEDRDRAAEKCSKYKD